MANLKHVVSDLHQVYLVEMDAKIKPQLDKSSSSPSASADDAKKESGGGEEGIKKAARQLAYDTRYKARREGIPLERAFSQALSNSSASAPVKDAAKSMLFSGGDKKEEVENEGNSIDEVRKGDKDMVRVTPKKGYGDQKGYVRFANRTKTKELRDNPQIQSVTPTSHGEPYEGKYKLKPGENKNTKGDLDGDGTKEPDKHEYAGVKDKAIKASMKKKNKEEKTQESFSNWKSELGLSEDTMVEVVGQNKEKKVKEGAKVKNVININPELKEGIGKLGGEVLGIEEVDEAVYGGTPDKKAEPKDTRMTVTNADKKGNTKAYQNYLKGLKNKKGQPVYKAADHMKESDSAKKINAEAVDSTSTLSAKQQDTERVQAQNARNQLSLDQTAAINKKKKDAADRAALKREIKQEVGEDTELDERTRYAKETGKDPQTGRPSERGGTIKPGSAMSKVRKSLAGQGLMSSRGKGIQPQGQTKKKGAKGYQGQTPVDKIKARLAKNRAPKPNPYRPRAGESD